MLLTTLLLFTAARGQIASTGTIIAGTVTAKGQTVVKLRWAMDDGAFPDGGFNVYRTEGATKVQLTGTPAKLATTLNRTDKVLAMALNPITVSKGHRLMNRQAGNRGTSVNEFRSIGQTVAAAPAGSSPAALRKMIAPVVQGFNAKLLKPAAPPTTPPLEDQVAEARAKLIMRAFLDDTTAQTAGLGMTDTTAQVGHIYTYTLTAIVGGQEKQVASLANFKVGSDPLPPNPQVEAPVQISMDGEMLHMEIPAGVDEAAFGLLYFRVTRTDSGNPSPVLVGKGQIFPTYLTLANGGEVPSLTSYFDTGVGMNFGNFTYTISVVDCFGRSCPNPVTLQGNFKNLFTPVASAGITGDYDASQGQAVNVHWAPSDNESNVTAFTGRTQYTLERHDEDNPTSPWVTLQTNAAPVHATNDQIFVSDLVRIYPTFYTTLSGLIPFPEINPKQLHEMQVNNALKMTVTQFLAAYPNGTNAINALLPIDIYRDASVSPDHYYTYRVTPYLTQSKLNGGSTVSHRVGVPALVMPGSPTGIAVTDAAAPADLATIKGSATNVLQLQNSHGIYSPGSLVASMGSITAGRNALSKTSKYKAGSLSKLQSSVPANYGRMESLHWTAPAYATPVSYDVYRANGTGFKSAGASTQAGDHALRASAEGVQGNVRRLAGNLPKVVGKGSFIASNTKFVFQLDTPPPDAEFVKIGSSKPGETSFTDLIPRSFANTYYYYVVPVNRWNAVGTRSGSTKVKIKPSLPPSVPVVLTVLATPTQTVQASIQPNLQLEDVVSYTLYRYGIPKPVVTTDATGGTGSVTGGKFITGAAPKLAGGMKVTALYAGRPLVATGAGAGGSAKFGIVRSNSALGPLASYQALSKQALVSKVAAPVLPDNLKHFFVNSNYTAVATLTANPSSTSTVVLTDSTVQPGYTYAYRIVAVNSVGMVSEYSAIMDAEVMHVYANPATLVGQPSYDSGKNQITFKVQSAGAQMFVVERALDGAAQTKWVQVGSVAADSTGAASVIDGMVRAGGQTYFYRISAFDVDGNTSVQVNGASTTGYLSVTAKTT